MGLAFASLVWAMAALAVVQGLRRAAMWQAGTPARVDWLAGLFALPRRYLVDVHDVVARDAYASRMHAIVAGGLLAAGLLTAFAIVPALAASRLYWALVTLAFAAMTAGSLLVGARRTRKRMPRRLSRGRFQILPFLLLAYGIGGVASAGLLALGSAPALLPFALLLAAIGGLGLAGEVRHGPMRHALAGALHLIAHPRPGRFSGKHDTALAPLDLEAGGDRTTTFGAAHAGNFAWNQLLSFDACVQCGRCETACPAFAAGQPLNPKKLIQDLATRSAEPAYAGSHPGLGGHAPNGQVIELVGNEAVIRPETLWSCTTCRACVEECPMMIEHVDAVVALRRYQTLELGAVPEKAAAPLEALRGAGTASGRPLASRTDFSAGLPLPLMGQRGEAEVLLWLGEGAFDLRYGRTLRALVKLLVEAKVDFAVLGAEERDCGDLARRLGDEATFQALARANVATLARYKFSRILTADPHALHLLRNEYSAFGGTYEVCHHTAFLLELVEAGRLSPTRKDVSLTYHDPCYLARYNGETEAPRRLLAYVATAPREMARSGRRAMCCGGGGGAPISDIPGETRIPDLRMGQAAETGAGIVAVACPTCTAMLEGVAGRAMEVKDVAELLLDACGSDAREAA